MLQDGAKEIKIFGEIVPVRAKVETIDGFSAHADQQEIFRWLKHFKQAPGKTYVIHGVVKARWTLASIEAH